MSRHLHFMGVGGVGMCGMAELLLAEGATVSGCDLEASERTERLATLGATIHIGHDKSHIAGVDTLVVSAAVDSQQPELVAASERGVPVALRSELLAEMMRGRRGVAVSGTHGKTTTTALIGHLVTAAGLDPTVLVGGHVRSLESHVRRGFGELMVCEADEYRRSFLELAPQIAVITNVEPEHLDTYRDADDVQAAFAAFANRTASDGAVVISADDPGARAVRRLLRRRAVRFGESEDADLRATDITTGASGCRFGVSWLGRDLGAVRLPLVGHHNVSNALAAIAVGIELGIAYEQLAEDCGRFEGVARRFEIRGERSGVTVVDDYAHHPTELRAVLEAARQAMPGRRLVAVFQPHLYSRTKHFASEFGAALTIADVAVVLPVYPARETPIPGVSSQLIVDEAARQGHRHVMSGPATGEASRLLDDLLEEGDLLLTMGAGDVYHVGERWLEVGS